MQIVIRTDASAKIGAGHVMRCLTLADALKQKGATVSFISRDMPQALAALTVEKGHKILSPPDDGACLSVLAEMRPDWLVVDHYELDAHFERAMRPAVKRIMVIDDLADRVHDCEVLLDQNLGRTVQDYQGLVPSHCRLLIGPRYALLRPDFAQFRERSLKGRECVTVQHILISMGGFDGDNVTGDVLRALKTCDLPEGALLSVVMGRDAPWIGNVKALAKTLPWPTEVLVGRHDMAQLMTESDLAIGAAGSSTWERCCLGLPAIMIILADNQKKIASSVSKLYGLQALEMSFSEADLKRSIAHFLVPEKYYAAVVASSELCNGKGVSSVIESINTEPLS